MEICLNDEWGTVCDQNWNVTDAGVVCRQLNMAYIGTIAISEPRFVTLVLLPACLMKFSSSPNLGAEAFIGSNFSAGSGRIWLDNVQCTGSERTIINCAASSTGNNSCTHAQDAGVRCPPGIFVILFNTVIECN